MPVRIIPLILISIYLILAAGCDKEEFTQDPNDRINISLDTLSFDTVFTEQATVTRLFKIYNPHDRSIQLSRVYVKGGASSGFRLNVDGLPGTDLKNILLPPKDSIYVFVALTLDPVGGDMPLVVYDAIVFEYNGTESQITLEAFGQDVFLIRGILPESATWTAGKPYLIYRNLVIDEDQTLTIEAGARIYLHYNASIVVYGKLIVNGTLEAPVTFEGDRFDRGYDELAGRWGTIIFQPGSTGNLLRYAIIKNAQAGLQVGIPGEFEVQPSVVLHNTLIQNSSFSSILAFGAQIEAYNCIFADAQYYGLILLMGGEYNFFHSSISIYGALEKNVYETKYKRGNPSNALFFSNWYPYYVLNEYYLVEEKTANIELVSANFINTIVYGSNKLELNKDDNGQTAFNFQFENCILKLVEDSVEAYGSEHFKMVILNQDPRFVNDSILLGPLDFRLDTLSPAMDAGSLVRVNAHLPYLQFDYDGNDRTLDGKPDLGAFERQE